MLQYYQKAIKEQFDFKTVFCPFVNINTKISAFVLSSYTCKYYVILPIKDETHLGVISSNRTGHKIYEVL